MVNAKEHEAKRRRTPGGSGEYQLGIFGRDVALRVRGSGGSVGGLRGLFVSLGFWNGWAPC